jgi:hypothetical protein
LPNGFCALCIGRSSPRKFCDGISNWSATYETRFGVEENRGRGRGGGDVAVASSPCDDYFFLAAFFAGFFAAAFFAAMRTPPPFDVKMLVSAYVV